MNLTIAIPTYNNLATIVPVLKSLQIQKHKLDVIIMDNYSTDGTFELIKIIQDKDLFNNLSIKLEQIARMPGGKRQNIEFARYKLSHAITTKYMMFLDADVILPMFAVEQLLSYFKENNFGMVGIRYEPLANHVQMGATMLLTEIARKINWKFKDICDCKNAAIQLQKDYDLETAYHPALQARHINILINI